MGILTTFSTKEYFQYHSFAHFLSNKHPLLVLYITLPPIFHFSILIVLNSCCAQKWDNFADRLQINMRSNNGLQFTNRSQFIALQQAFNNLHIRLLFLRNHSYNTCRSQHDVLPTLLDLDWRDPSPHLSVTQRLWSSGDRSAQTT